MLFGAHISVGGGYPEAVEYAASVGCETMQVFAKSPRQWAAKPLDPTTARDFIAAREASGMGPVFTHTAYLINLTTTDTDLREKSIAALSDELARAGLLRADGVVTHTGTDPAADPEAAAHRLGSAIAQAFELAGEVAREVRLLLENTAGSGSSYGARWRELGSAIHFSELEPARLGVCLDTCHAFAQGYDLSTLDGWRSIIEEIDAEVGLDRLGLLHTNDCLYALGSRRDRHAWIGEGYIGYEGFRAMACCPELTSVPGVCEVAGEKPEKDAVNIARLRSLRDECV